MTLARGGLLTVLALLLPGCIPSLHPLYTKEDSVFEPQLLGPWVQDDGKNQWTFTKEGEKAYSVVYTEDGNPAKFDGHLVKLGNALFLDLFPKDPPIKNHFYGMHLVPAHTFLKLTLHQDQLRMAAMNPDWLSKKMEAGEVTIKHEKIEGAVVLTASTGELQEFVGMYADDREAFGEGGLFHRKK